MADETAPQQTPLAGPDAAWLRMETPTNLMVVNGLLCFDDPLTYAEVEELIRERLLVIERFTQRVVPQERAHIRPHWEPDPHFSIESHLHHVAVPAPGEEALRRFLNDMFSQPLDMNRPLWHFYLVEGVGAGNALVIRIHHSLADGFSLLYLMTKLADPGREITFPTGEVITPGAPDPSHEEVAEIAEEVRERSWVPNLPDPEALAQISDPARLREVLRQSLIAPAVAGHLLVMPDERETSLRGPLTPRKRVDWTRPLSLERVKRVAHSFGGTVNDVLLLALTSSLRSLLATRGEELEPGENLRCVMPVNLRPFEDRGDDMGNGFGLVFVELPVGETDPQRRLDALEARITELKQSPEAFVLYAALMVAGMSPASVQTQIVKLFMKKATMITTNVPGPTAPVYFAGRPITRMRFWVPQSADIGLGFSIFSYCGEVSLGVQADETLLPNPEHWVDAFHRAFDELAAEVGV